ncbi:hypothetical protein ABZ837_00840 [Streptomyces sp. NPDC047197]|uniref:hypothetical protein n=1 Tax=Streptomyces sp. NPDC047197 TaxID=3155477 RepID=UPI0033FE0B90
MAGDVTADLRRRLVERHERQQLDRMQRAASEVITSRIPASTEVPEAALEAVREFWNISTEPAGTLRDEAGEERLDSWTGELLTRPGCRGRSGLDLDAGLEDSEIGQAPADWFTPFDSAHARDSARGFHHA